MDDMHMTEQVRKAVAQRCASLTPDPFLAARVMRMAEEKGELKVKRKLSVGFILCILMVLLSLTAIAAALLSGMEVVEQEAVPLAQGNDREVRRNEMYSPEELAELIRVAAENGIILDDESSIMAALHAGKGYYEEEAIMAICREAFGGLFYEWTVEQQHWYQEMMIAIGYADSNPYWLPAEWQMSSADARALAVSALQEAYGADLPLDDPTQYRKVEDFDDTSWTFTFYPRSMTLPQCTVSFDDEGNGVEHSCKQQDWSSYTERELTDGISEIYGYRTYSQYSWGLDAWHVFGQMLPAAQRTEAWTAEYDGYLATTYLLPEESDLTADEAKSIALKDAGAQYATDSIMLLLGEGDRRIWKVTLTLPAQQEEQERRSWEIDAQTGEIITQTPFTDDMLHWASYMLNATYEAVRSDMMTSAHAKEIAIAALRESFSNPDLPLDDPNLYEITVRTVGSGSHFNVIFSTKSLDWGACFVEVSADGSSSIRYAHLAPLNPDNLNDRFDEVYGSSLRWDQSLWVAFDQMLDTMGEPLTFEGKLFAATSYPDASAAKVTLDEALDIVQADLGTLADDPLSWVLIAAEPNPVWKIRMSTYPANTLYEVDAMTGEIVDKELYVCQRDDFDHSMKMFTLRSTYMPAALAEFGPVRIAMELTVKAYHDEFSTDEAIFMDKDVYQITQDGLTVTFTALQEGMASFRTTILDNGMDAAIERLN